VRFIWTSQRKKPRIGASYDTGPFSVLLLSLEFDKG
jgi:hypothetical protein